MFLTKNNFNLLILLLLFPLILNGQDKNNSKFKKTEENITHELYRGDKYVDIKDFYNHSSPTAGFQEAVDYLRSEGGTIFVSPGTYKIRKSIILFSGIYILGCGEHSVIERMDSCIQKPLESAGREGDFEIQVRDVNGFFKGGEITIASNTAKYWDCTNATILEVNNKSIKINQPLKKNYLPEDEAAVMNFFPVFTATREGNIRIENLTIDGKMKLGSNFGCHFVCSAIHFNEVYNSRVEKVIVRRYPADGFSVQRGGSITVTNCLAEYNLGNGFHPGTGLTVSTWSRNIGRYNSLDGLFFCWQVKYATVSDSHFYNNKKNGIGDLGNGGTGDQMNIVSGNFCYNNDRSGIECTPGGNNTVTNNVCENNSQAEPGKWPGIYLKNTHSSIFQGNRCCESNSSDSGKTQSYGILLIGKCENNVISGNILTGHSKGGIAGDNLEMNTIVQNISLDKHISDASH